MAIKFTVVGTEDGKKKLILIDTAQSDKEIFDRPIHDIYYYIENLNQGYVVLYDVTNEITRPGKLYGPIPVTDCQDELGTPFDASSFKLWARENLGNFKSASGGSGAVNSVNSGYWINVNNSDPANPIVNFDGVNYYAIEQAGLTRLNQTTVALANTQSLVFEDYLSGSFTPNQGGLHEIGAFYRWSSNSVFQNVLVKLTINQQGGGLSETILAEVEAKDAGGTGVVVNVLQGGNIVGNVNTGTDQRTPDVLKDVFNLVEGETYDVVLQWTAPPGHIPTLYSGFIYCDQKTN